MTPQPLFVRVAVPVPSLDLLTYAVPEGQPTPSVGARVVVPLGPRSVTGIIVDVSHASTAPEGTDVKPLKQVLDAEPFIPSDVVDLARWTAEYYAAGAGEAITAVLPPKTRGERVDAHKTARFISLSAAGMDPQLQATARQREALGLLRGALDGISSTDLTKRGISADVITRLLKAGLVNARQERVDRDPFSSAASELVPPDSARKLSLEQDRALEKLLRLTETLVGEAIQPRHGLEHTVVGVQAFRRTLTRASRLHRPHSIGNHGGVSPVEFRPLEQPSEMTHPRGPS